MDSIVKRLMENRHTEKALTEDYISDMSKEANKVQKYLHDNGFTSAIVRIGNHSDLEVTGYDEGQKMYDLVKKLSDIGYSSEDSDYEMSDYGLVAEINKKAGKLGEDIDPTLNEDLKKYVGKPLKALLADLSGKVKLDIRSSKPNHYGVSGFGGMCNQVTWDWADMLIKEIAAGTGKYVDIYIKV